MLYRPHLMNALHERRDDFERFEREWRDGVSLAAARLHELGRRTSAEIRRALEALKSPGALPSDELTKVGGFGVSFQNRWRSHEEARRWASQVLRNRVTFAADGSQILPEREISLPVAAVQIASFENPHTDDGQSYRKQIKFEIIAPDELLTEAEQMSAAETVNWRRFRLETKTVAEFLESRAGWQSRNERAPVAFFDGTLLVSYTPERTAQQQKYIDATRDLVKLSKETRVPLVGFIDQSFARDLVGLLEACRNRFDFSTGATPLRSSLYDAQLLRAEVESESESKSVLESETGSASILGNWGDRTIFCECLRSGLIENLLDERGRSIAGFIYLQTTADAAPARLDVPTWIYDAGLLEEVIDAVRAECIVGNGYPYAIETADATAVLTARDRELFLQAVQEFAARESLPFRVAHKAISKGRRR